MNCKHRKTWLLPATEGTMWEWCYECGALREMTRLANQNGCVPATYFQRPVGSGGENPYPLKARVGAA